MPFRSALVALISLAACGGDGVLVIDARPQPDGASDGSSSTGAVQPITCPSGTIPTVTTSGTAYLPPSLAINVGETVKFILSPEHNLTPDPAGPNDPALLVDFGATACFKFDRAGTYGFVCTVHRFNGQVVVR